MNRKAWLVALLLVCAAFPALAQKFTVSGTVTDATGEPLIGASVLVKGTMTGTATDLDGNYVIEAEHNSVLTFSYVGYNTQDVAVEGRTTVNVVMHENSVVLNEVVAIGYGVVKKSDATGSVAVIKPDEISAAIATSTQDLLVGASPGVVVTTNGGDPTGNAEIRIRGGNSLTASNAPLIVIDGVPMTNQSNAGGTNAMTMVNPQDIESMTVLKDASATAIYGSRASNGVIIITTKKGKSGAPKVSFAANFHLNTARKTLDMMSAHELRPYVVDQYGEEVAQQVMGEHNTNWQDEILRTSFSQDYALSVSGSLDWLPYRVSASYTDNQGILKNSGMQRTTAGITLTPKFFDGELQVTANLMGTYARSRQADSGALGTAISYNPSRPVHYKYPTVGNSGMTMFNGYWNITESNGNINPLCSRNPVQMLAERSNVGETYQGNGNIQFDYALHFLPELHFNLNLGFQVSKNQSWNDTAPNSIMSWYDQNLYNTRLETGDGIVTAAGAGARTKWYELQRNTLLEFYANYRKDFDEIKSTLDVMAGYSWQRFDYHGRSHYMVNSPGFVTDNSPYVPYDPATGTYTLDQYSQSLAGTRVSGSTMTRWAEKLMLVSFYGRVNYTFDDTYLLTFTLRDDGSSRFSKDNRWGLFPSLALGWKFMNMDFMEDIRQYVNEGKLRLGWGITGQQDLNTSFLPYMPVYISSYQPGFHYLAHSDAGNGVQNWIDPLYPRPYDEGIKWEETTTWNIGLDLGILNNRITFSADWYLRQTKDLLFEGFFAGQATSNFLLRNVGSMRNTGVEFNVTARPIVNKDFTWTTSFNAAYNHNKVTKLDGDKNDMSNANTPVGIGTPLRYFLVGEPINTFMVYEQVYDRHGDPIPGQYVDQNGDGQINDADKIKYHTAEPDWTFNWTNTFNYKNWDFGITLRASLGNYNYNGPRLSNTRLSNVLTNQIQVNNLMRGEYLFPADTDLNNLVLSNYWIENASFIRCDNISVGYTFNNLLNNRLNLRVFGVVQNPFVITKYKGIDPEVFGGIDNDIYPRPITVTLGLTATF
ncbi:MAG: TonB-dependent receptor [Muribaculum sp.]|nr:TonB-dependent receptor [Muribaculaceae bacterium]MCM1081175.1 TonB-dependent receptor [Muribaculum sp.]